MAAAGATVTMAEGTTDSPGTLTGYAIRYDSINGYRERVARGAFADVVRSRQDVNGYSNHDHGRVLARRSAGTLRLRDESDGLIVEMDLPDTQEGRDTATLIRRGDIDGLSIGFNLRGSQHTESRGIRTWQRIALDEVSVVSRPAFGDARISDIRTWPVGGTGLIHAAARLHS